MTGWKKKRTRFALNELPSTHVARMEDPRLRQLLGDLAQRLAELSQQTSFDVALKSKAQPETQDRKEGDHAPIFEDARSKRHRRV